MCVICGRLFQSICTCCCPKEENILVMSVYENKVETIKSAEPSAIMAGESLRGTSIENISHNIDTIRNVSIQITNFSDMYTLANPRVHTSSGYCLSPPQPTITKKTSESCSFTKTPYVAQGSVGVLTYEILTDEGQRVGELAIMFSVPFNYYKWENCVGLGIYEQQISCDDELFHQMYYEKGPFTATVATGSLITYSGKGTCVKGTMSPAGNAIMKVEFRDL
ncbi:nigrelysin [Ictalurus punctatus]|uniref:Nigrelysin n=1 Tax=Ictalurus punctatus TaxID=7998 RepID=A0A2D0RLQ3_ICTPU|nr:nigrelysin [Ictalurus punctatus]